MTTYVQSQVCVGLHDRGVSCALPRDCAVRTCGCGAGYGRTL